MRRLLPLLLLLSCGSSLEPGSYGTLRFVGRVNGETPLRLVPPIADVDGNVYTAFGAIDRPGTQVFVSAYAGGQGPSCDRTKGSVGLHGFVGYGSDRAWYWSGDGLFLVTPETCGPVLDTDPNTNANLFFRGVVPFVFDAPSRRTAVALVTAQDDVPSLARVDLDRNIFTDVAPVPGDTADLVVLGVGANREERLGVIVVRSRGGTRALFLDETSSVLASVNLPLPDDLPAYALKGYLAVAPSSLTAGVFGDGKLVVFDEGSGRVADAPGMTPLGVHLWKERLHVVGTARDQPVVASLNDDGTLEGPVLWESSVEAARTTAATIYDDRTPPARDVEWTNVRTAFGPFPFVSPFSPFAYADDLSLWLVAGPVTDGGQSRRTSIAVGSVGLAYP